MTAPDPYYASTDPAYDLGTDEEPNAATQVLLGHTGTLDTSGYGMGSADRVVTRGGYDTVLGSDTSAAAINPFLSPDLDPLPEGYATAPTYDSPIY